VHDSMSQQTTLPQKSFTSLFTQHVYVMQSKTLSDMTNNVFIRYFKILYTALLIKLLSIVSTDFCGSVTSKPYSIIGKQNDCLCSIQMDLNIGSTQVLVCHRRVNRLGYLDLVRNIAIGEGVTDSFYFNNTINFRP